jgi:hypothetical protein
MRLASTTIVFASFALASLQLASSARAEEPLREISIASPAEATLQRWHRSLVTGNWDEYQRLVLPVPGVSIQARKAEFDALREWTPDKVKITAPRTLANGNLDFFILGCAKGRRQAAGGTLVRSGSDWLVLASGWGDVWSPDVKKCPV